MADAVTTQVILDGLHRAIVRLTGVSDGSGEAAVAKIDPADFTPEPNRFVLEKAYGEVVGETVQLFWDATSPALIFASAMDFEFCWKETGGLFAPADLVGQTGKILLTTLGFGDGSTYSMTLELRKKMAAAP